MKKENIKLLVTGNIRSAINELKDFAGFKSDTEVVENAVLNYFRIVRETADKAIEYQREIKRLREENESLKHRLDRPEARFL